LIFGVRVLKTKVNIIIPMAGHSRRFNEAGYLGPKALLPVGKQTMISHVVNMFDVTTCKYYIVINRKQLEYNPTLIDDLTKLAASLKVVVIDEHELGPVFSALQVRDIPVDEEVIISYCDFIVEWNYFLFLRHIQGKDGSVASFRGFHPASFGDTYYAYMRVEDDHMLELREKRSFTDSRSEEHASAGIYYFKNFGLFKMYADKWLKKKNTVLPEVYVSLLYNDMVQDGLSVVIHEVDKFICLGTPDDYEQYKFWYKYYSENQNKDVQSSCGVKRVGLIPMAGKGSRFREYGYRVAKPLIQINNQPMVLKTIGSMPDQDKWIFLPRKDDADRYPIEDTLRSFSDDCILYPVQKHTSGQAATCMLVADQIDDDSELMIASADYEHRYDIYKWKNILNDMSIDGAIWTYRSGSMVLKDPEKFAYCRVNDDGVTVEEVVEKQTISNMPSLDPLVVGTFWYRQASDFKLAATNLIENDITVNSEHYVGTSINYLIEQGKKIVIFDIEQWISFGDPFELSVLEYWGEYFGIVD